MVFLLVPKIRLSVYRCDINDISKLPNPSLSANKNSNLARHPQASKAARSGLPVVKRW